VHRTDAQFGALVAVQAVHSVEEYAGRLYDVFPPARWVTGLAFDSRERGFIVINAALVAFGLWCLLVPVRRHWPSRVGLIWVWVWMEMINGVVHSAWSVMQGAYTPGAASAPVLLVVALLVARSVAREHRPAGVAEGAE
jgi:hypothetical protein